MLPKKRGAVERGHHSDSDPAERGAETKKLCSETGTAAGRDANANAIRIGGVDGNRDGDSGGPDTHEGGQDFGRMATRTANEVEIDEDLHSRQLAVYGRETMRRLFGSNVLVSGLKGLGAEVAKNVILAGVKSVVLHDTELVQLSDLSAQFYLSETDVGTNRAVACAEKFQELNKSVAVSTFTQAIDEEFLKSFQAVVFTDLPLSQSILFDEFCRSQDPPIAFIRSEIRGVFGTVFCDFGAGFTVSDVDGEEPFSGILASISNGNPALITCVDDERLGFDDGDFVTFSEVEGMTQLNDGKPRKVRDVRAHSFLLEEDTSTFTPYIGGGIVTQVKQPKVLNFKSLKEALKEPGEFLLSDFAKFDRPALLQLAFQALDSFRSQHQRFPQPGSSADADKLIHLVKELNESSGPNKQDTIDELVVRLFASGSSGELTAMAATFGGIVGQEVVKACSGKFHPLFQFLYFDSLESLPDKPLSPEEVAPTGSRYDGQVSVVGHSMQRQLADAKVFLVGAGALGCEFLKNLALMGVACGESGRIIVTDDDVIEKSNLSRQFLFRDWNIGQPKSSVASVAAKAINPNLNVTALQNRVGTETESVFDDAFWDGLTVVINALDNVNARLYVDARCVYFGKPLLESGTLGTKCNTQVVIPHLTENYGASRDPPERQAPMCTVHSFPHNIHHCLTWARSEFEGLFDKTPKEVNTFLENREEYKAAVIKAGDAQSRDSLERIIECIVKEKCSSIEDCVTWARFKFGDYFYNRVKQLTFTFPEDSVTSTGLPFWSAPKRFPLALNFDTTDKSHLSFVQAAAILKAETFGIPRPAWVYDLNEVAKFVATVKVPEFVPVQGVKIVTDEKATSLHADSMDDDSVILKLIDTLEKGIKESDSSFRMVPIEFEKDDDKNFHMDMIAGLANMRARNYGIAEVDKLKAKFIAGRIIPAIATTTAMATGLVCLELYKLLLNHPIEKYRNTFANLALPLFSMAEPVPPKTYVHRDMKWSIWDRWIIEGNVTLRELLDWFAKKGLNAYSISCGQALLYNMIFPKHKERMDKTVHKLALDVAKLEVPETRKHFDVVVACDDEDDNDLDVPLVSIKFR